MLSTLWNFDSGLHRTITGSYPLIIGASRDHATLCFCSQLLCLSLLHFLSSSTFPSSLRRSASVPASELLQARARVLSGRSTHCRYCLLQGRRVGLLACGRAQEQSSEGSAGERLFWHAGSTRVDVLACRQILAYSKGTKALSSCPRSCTELVVRIPQDVVTLLLAEWYHSIQSLHCVVTVNSSFPGHRQSKPTLLQSEAQTVVTFLCVCACMCAD